MRAVIFIVIAAILGSSLVGVGHMSGNQDDNHSDWYKKIWDYFDFNKLTGFMNSGGSNNDHGGKCDCEERKENHKEHYDGYKKYHDDKKSKFSKEDYKTYLEDFKQYFDNNKKLFDKEDFKQYTDYYRKILDEDKNQFNKDDWDKYDKEYKNYMNEYPNHPDHCTCMDDNDDHTMIDHARIDFNIVQRKLTDINGQTYFQNIVDKCIFSSEDTFSPLCIKCKFLKSDGKTVVATGEINEDRPYIKNTQIPIMMFPPFAGSDKPVANDVQNVDKVEIRICGMKDKCPDGTCKCDERKKDHSQHYYDFYKRYEDNKKKFGKSDYSTFMNDYENYINENGRYMDSYDFKMFMDYHEKFLKDNKKSYSDSDYKQHSKKHEEYSKDYPNHHEKCNCHGEKEDHKTHYDNFDKYYKSNKNKFGKSEYSTFMDNYENYMNEEGKYMDSSECKMFDNYHGQFLKDNKKSFSDSDYKRHSEEHEKHSRDCPKHDEEENECKEKSGFFTGGGKVKFGTTQVTHGFELHCDKTQGPNNLEINWNGNKFHLEQLITANCYDDGSANEPPPSPHPGPTLDVYSGNGYGRYNGQCGALAEWVMDDNGEPGKADQIVALRITGADHLTKLDINPSELGVIDTSRSGTWKNPGSNDNSIWLDLQSGNHQFVPHPSAHTNPPTQTNPCPPVLTP